MITTLFGPACSNCPVVLRMKSKTFLYHKTKYECILYSWLSFKFLPSSNKYFPPFFFLYCFPVKLA